MEGQTMTDFDTLIQRLDQTGTQDRLTLGVGDPNPWLCTLCGRMSSPSHIGALHRIHLFDVQSQLLWSPRTPEQVEANIEERSEMVLAAQAQLAVRWR